LRPRQLPRLLLVALLGQLVIWSIGSFFPWFDSTFKRLTGGFFIAVFMWVLAQDKVVKAEAVAVSRSRWWHFLLWPALAIIAAGLVLVPTHVRCKQDGTFYLDGEEKVCRKGETLTYWPWEIGWVTSHAEIANGFGGSARTRVLPFSVNALDYPSAFSTKVQVRVELSSDAAEDWSASDEVSPYAIAVPGIEGTRHIGRDGLLLVRGPVAEPVESEPPVSGPETVAAEIWPGRAVTASVYFRGDQCARATHRVPLEGESVWVIESCR
jgi:hypothetical protein